jgi:dolichyl-phosphate beta-glucosyltransferase
MAAKSTHWESVKAEIGKEFDLSIIIPAYNESKRILPYLYEIFDYINSQQIRAEVIVVNDGSKDDTAEIISNESRTFNNLSLLNQPQNMGKGAAVRAGVVHSRGKNVLFTDADGSTPIKELKRMMIALNSGGEVIAGSRALFSTETKIETVWYRKVLGRVFNFMVNLLILPGVKDTQCGFKLFTAKAAHILFSNQTLNGFSFDLELLYLTKKFGFAFREVPVNWHNVEGSKVNLVTDSTKMFIDIFRIILRHWE